MTKTLDDIYREVLWMTNTNTNDLPYKYTSGGAYGFLQLFGDVYKNLVQELVATDQNMFLNRNTDSLVANQEIYYLPTDLFRLRHIEFQYDGASWYPGTEIDPAFFLRGGEQPLVSAATIAHPYFWLGDTSLGATASGQPYHVVPRPTANITGGILIYYDAMPSGLLINHISAAMSAASAKVQFPAEFNYLLSLGSAIEIWGKYGGLEQKAGEVARYEQGLKNMKQLIKPRVSIGQKRVRDLRELNQRDV